MQRGHGDHEREKVVDEGIERLVGERTPWKMSNRLQLVIQEKLWEHEQEAKAVDETDEHLQAPRVPAFVRRVKQ
jgi:hypothetical protein